MPVVKEVSLLTIGGDCSISIISLGECGCCVGVGDESEEDSFSGELEVGHQMLIAAGLGAWEILSLVDSDQVESDSVNVNVVDVSMDEDVVQIELKGGDGCRAWHSYSGSGSGSDTDKTSELIP